MVYQPVQMLRGVDLAQILELGSTLVIGRAPDCDLVVASRSVSARHAALELLGSGDAVLHDLNSLNGTFVNDTRLKGQRVSLSDGDTLRFGYDPSSYRYEANAAPPGAELEEILPSAEPQVVPARPPPPPRDQWLPRAELASAEGCAVVTSTAGLRSPQTRLPPQQVYPEPASPVAAAVAPAATAPAAAAPAAPPGADPYDSYPNSPVGAHAEENEECAATVVLGSAPAEGAPSRDTVPHRPSTGTFHQSEDSPGVVYNEPPPAKHSTSHLGVQLQEPLEDRVSSGLREHKQRLAAGGLATEPSVDSTATHHSAPQQPGPQDVSQPSADALQQPTVRAPQPRPSAPTAQQVHQPSASWAEAAQPSAAPLPPHTAVEGMAWSHPMPAQEPPPARMAPREAAPDLSRLHRITQQLLEQLTSAGFEQFSGTIQELSHRHSSVELYCEALEAAKPAFQELSAEGGGGKHYVRELRRRVSVLSSELRESQAQLGELLGQDWAQALSGSQAKVKQLESMLHDRQRDLEEAQATLVSKFVAQSTSGPSDEAKLHAFVSNQAKEVSLARSEVAELERRCAALVEHRTEEARRASELEQLLEASREVEAQAAGRCAGKIQELQARNTELNLKFARIAAGGKPARKNAAEVLVAQVHTLEEELRQQWSKHQAELSELQRSSSVAPPDQSQALIAQLQAELHQRQSQAVTVAELVQLRDSSAGLHVELETLRRENGQLRGLLVARGGAELVDDSGPLSCLSEVIARRDETIAELKRQVGASKTVPGWDVPGTWQRTAEAPIPELVVEEEAAPLSARPWEGRKTPFVFDSSEEGLHSLDSLDQYEYSSSNCVGEDSVSMSEYQSEYHSDHESIDADGV